MKVFAFFMVVITLSSIGLPGTNGFVGEFLILAGTFREALSSPGGINTSLLVMGIVASTGVVLGAIYMLTMVRKVLFGPITHEENRNLPDVTFREGFILGILVVLVFWIGVFPNVFLSRTSASVGALIDTCKGRMVEHRLAALPALRSDGEVYR